MYERHQVSISASSVIKLRKSTDKAHQSYLQCFVVLVDIGGMNGGRADCRCQVPSIGAQLCGAGQNRLLAHGSRPADEQLGAESEVGRERLEVLKQVDSTAGQKVGIDAHGRGGEVATLVRNVHLNCLPLSLVGLS